jgi:Ca2+-transporting ATPase
MEKMHYNIAGLNEQEVIASRSAHGHNALKGKKDNGFLRAIKDLAKEPMFILLLAASVIYFIGGQKAEGIFMAISIVLVASGTMMTRKSTVMKL